MTSPSSRIAIAVDRRTMRRWHTHLRDRLAPVAEVRFLEAPPCPPLPGAVAALLALERNVLHRGRDALFDRMEVPFPDWLEDGDSVDMVIDVAGGAAVTRAGAGSLRPLFDGEASEAALVAALLAGVMPDIALVDGGTGEALATGRPSGENGGGLTGGLDAVLSRVLVLIEGQIRAPRRLGPTAKPVPRHHAPSHAAAVLVRALARSAAYAAYRLCMFTPHWRVGWRHNSGPGVIERRDLGGPTWTVLPDPGHRFFADPFPILRDGRHFIFVEDFDHRAGKGTVSAVEIVEGVPRAPVPVLEEPWHLSYPMLIEDEGHLYMVPEASQSGAVTLYRCTAFPGKWEPCATLLGGVEAADATVFRHGGRFWMTAVTREGRGGFSDTLRIWHAPALLGPWTEHGRVPVMVDIATARPGGAVVASGGHLWRPFQDCAAGYGHGLGLARIDRLDPDHFEETVVSRLYSGPRWPGRRLHTLNRWGSLECIDGSAFMPRLPALRPWVAARERPAPEEAAGM